MTLPLLVHATTVAIDRMGVLLRGPSGSGKSDLALRLIDAGARLVADDQSELRRAGNAVLVRAPESLLGLIEVRGIGILRCAPLSDVPLAVVVDLVAADRIERLPPPCRENVLGVDLPRLAVAPFEASAAAKVRAALRALAAPAGNAIIHG
jgi:serine kinase of HPr protein (carbohydrate metabolism regulator)